MAAQPHNKPRTVDAHIERLAAIISGANLKSLTVAHMEVPCCRGFIYAAQEAIKKSGVECPLKIMQIGIKIVAP